MTLSTRVSRPSFDVGSSDHELFGSLNGELAEKVSCDHTSGGTEHIVFVEDDTMIRKAIQHCLKELGYQVEAFASGQEVLAALSRNCPPIALLLTDHDMPGLTGYELAQRLRTEHPGVRVLLASGCSKDTIFPDGDPKDWPPFLPKPFTLESLARRLREILDGPAPNSNRSTCRDDGSHLLVND